MVRPRGELSGQIQPSPPFAAIHNHLLTRLRRRHLVAFASLRSKLLFLMPTNPSKPKASDAGRPGTLDSFVSATPKRNTQPSPTSSPSTQPDSKKARPAQASPWTKAVSSMAPSPMEIDSPLVGANGVVIKQEKIDAALAPPAPGPNMRSGRSVSPALGRSSASSGKTKEQTTLTGGRKVAGSTNSQESVATKIRSGSSNQPLGVHEDGVPTLKGKDSAGKLAGKSKAARTAATAKPDMATSGAAPHGRSTSLPPKRASRTNSASVPAGRRRSSRSQSPAAGQPNNTSGRSKGPGSKSRGRSRSRLPARWSVWSTASPAS